MCVDPESDDFKNFWAPRSLTWLTQRNFIDYESVKLGESAVESMIETVEGLPIDPTKSQLSQFSLIETKVSLEDSLW